MSMGMTSAGHVVHAQALFTQTFHLAWGELPVGYGDPWGLGDPIPSPLSSVVTETVNHPTANGVDNLAHVGVIKVARVQQNSTIYTPNVDFVIANGKQIDWSANGAEPAVGSDYQVTYRYYDDVINNLLQEVGRRESAIKAYAIEDPNGDIVANGTTWSISATPTRNIYLQFKFDADDAVGKIIHQVGICVGTVRNDVVPVGKKYLLPTEVKDKGLLYMLENLEPFSRPVGKREIFEYILTM